MSKNRNFLRDFNLGLLVLRLCIGGLLIFHGINKLIYGMGFIEQLLSKYGLPTFLAYGSLVAELICPLLIVFGKWTRASAAIIVFNMIIAILTVHLSTITSVDQNGGWSAELPALYLLGALALCFTGGGRYALSDKSILD